MSCSKMFSCIRKVLPVLGIVFLFVLLCPLNAKAAQIAGFDPVYYLIHNPDVAAVYGWDAQGALSHYLTYGMAEGRRGCAAEDEIKDDALSGFTVILDAGHGGRDPGCVRNGVYEKNVNLSIVLKLKTILESCGATVLLTRSDDSFVSLEYRYTFENLNPEAVFVSVHCNALSGNTNISGMSAYCHAVNNSDSALFASCVYENALYATGATGRGLKTMSDLKVVYYSYIPSVLIETGYLSSSEEFPLLTSPEYQDLIAAGIARGIINYQSISSSIPTM